MIYLQAIEIHPDNHTGSAIYPTVLSKYASQNKLRLEFQALTTKFNLHFKTTSLKNCWFPIISGK